MKPCNLISLMIFQNDCSQSPSFYEYFSSRVLLIHCWNSLVLPSEAEPTSLAWHGRSLCTGPLGRSLSSGFRRDFQRLGQEVREKSMSPKAVAGNREPRDVILGRDPWARPWLWVPGVGTEVAEPIWPEIMDIWGEAGGPGDRWHPLETWALCKISDPCHELWRTQGTETLRMTEAVWNWRWN